ncbi:MAG: type II toxin-antitoxin system VapC family toxin [Rhodanobacteraceae bacterium]
MRGFLLDTCVISESTRPRGSDRVRSWLDARATDSLFLSVISIGEIEKGIAQLGAKAAAGKLAKWLQHIVIPQFESRILDVDRAVATRWGRVSGVARRGGTSLPVVDALIGATALEHDLTLVTRNVADFAPLGIQIVNPWQ